MASDTNSVAVIQGYMDKAGTSRAIHENGELSIDALWHKAQNSRSLVYAPKYQVEEIHGLRIWSKDQK